jgi:hypothetical protein
MAFRNIVFVVARIVAIVAFWNGAGVAQARDALETAPLRPALDAPETGGRRPAGVTLAAQDVGGDFFKGVQDAVSEALASGPESHPVNRADYYFAVVAVAIVALLLSAYAGLQFAVIFSSEYGGSTLLREVARRLRTPAGARLEALRGVPGAEGRAVPQREAGAPPSPVARPTSIPPLLAKLTSLWRGRAEEPLPPVDLSRLERRARAPQDRPAAEPEPMMEQAAARAAPETPPPAPVAPPETPRPAAIAPERAPERVANAPADVETETDDLVLVEPGDAAATAALHATARRRAGVSGRA